MTEKSNGAKVPPMKVVKEDVDQCASHDAATVEKTAKQEEVDNTQLGDGDVDSKKLNDLPKSFELKARLIVKKAYDNLVAELSSELGEDVGFFVLVDVAGIGSFIGGGAPASASIGVLEMAKHNIIINQLKS